MKLFINVKKRHINCKEHDIVIDELRYKKKLNSIVLHMIAI